MCVLIPLQRAGALAFKVRGASSVTTKTTDADDITFTVRFRSEAGGVHALVYQIVGPTDEITKKIKVKPARLDITRKGRYDVTVTIPRSVIPTTPGIQKYLFFAADQLGSDIFEETFTVNVILPTDETVEVILSVIGDSYQELPANEIRDIVFTLKVKNKSSVPNLRIDLIQQVGQLELLDITQVQLTPNTVILAPNASKEVTLTIPRNLLTESANYSMIVTALSQRSLPISVTVNFSVIPNVRSGLVLEPSKGRVHTTTTTETYNVSYLFRLSNTGSDLDRITLAVSADFRAWLDQSEVVLFPDSFEDIELTIPRDSLTNAGTYEVVVTAHSANDSNVKDNIIFTTTVMEDSSTLTDPTEGTDETRQTPPDLSTHRVVLSEFMFESEGGENGLPQWIEVFNNKSSETNLRGWKLQWKRLQPSLLEVTTTFKEDFIIPAQQSRVIVTALGRHSGGGGVNLSDEAVYQLHVLHAEELLQDDIANRNRLITRGGFSLKLLNRNDVVVDQIGTLNGDQQTWQLHESLIDGVRSSLIRRFDHSVPRSGLERRGWRSAYNTKRLVAGLYYGHQNDLGTPGYRRGKPLPINLSHFSVRFDKDRVVINWTTESELNNAGFNILRSTSPTKNFRPINPKLIQGAGTTGQRNEYQFIDKTAKSDVAYYYRLEDVDLSGTRAFLNTYRLRGVITPTGKRITNWGTLKDDR